MRIRSTPGYGSDASGLVCGFVFAPGESPAPIDSIDAGAYLRDDTHAADERFVWLHFSLANIASEKWLRASGALPESFFEALHEGARSSRIESMDGRLLAVINDVVYDFSLDASDIATMWVSLDRNLVISARRKPLRSVDALRAAVKDGHHFASSTGLLIHLLHDQCDILSGIARRASDEVDSTEDDLLAGRIELREVNLAQTRRVLVRLRRLLAPEPTTLFRLLSHPPAWIAQPDLQQLRQSTEEFAVVLSEIAALLERIKVLQEEVSAQADRQNNRSLFLLTVFTVLALPINIVAGLLGMNVGGIPFAQNPDGFWLVVAVVATFTLPALWLVFRRHRD